VGEGRARLAASILDADQGNLAYAVRRAARAGADRIHLDVMDGHFVPNLTFGWRTIKALRRRTDLPFDAHLMISQPGRYIQEFIAAGCDSITIHVEVDEPIEPTLRAIKAAGRAAGLALKPATPLSALEPYQHLLDIIMVMTVEPGFGGQTFMRDVAAAKLLPAREYLSHVPITGEIHVDGGVNRDSAEFIGANGADVLVVGSALFRKGANMPREIRLIKALADEGYQYGLNKGQPPIPRDTWVTFTRLPKDLAEQFAPELVLGGVPVFVGPSRPPGGGGLCDVLVPTRGRELAEARFGARRREYEALAAARRAGEGDGSGVAEEEGSPWTARALEETRVDPAGDGPRPGADR
jgi:ribulose-phosphate 3-epimerase